MTEKETYSLREAYGKALVELGCTNPAIVALDADLGKSTFARMMGDLDENRYVEMGIAEQNMAAVSAGLAIAGKIPFFSSFAVFSTGRAYDQIRSSVCIPGFNVNICGSSAGLSDYGDGKTHQSIDDIALMRVLPRMAVLAPMDANQVYGMVEAMVEYDGPSYIRIPRNPLPALSERRPYEIGQLDLTKTVTVPRSVRFNDNFLMLEFITPGRQKEDYQERLGQELAALHRKTMEAASATDHRESQKQRKGFGFYEDNHIGATPQKNSWKSSWIEFYTENRLDCQVDLTGDRAVSTAYKKLKPRLQTIIGDSEEPPCLIHGDLWGGNVICGSDGGPVLIDPAACYAHRELELAMTTLFGGFSPVFYRGYNAAFPLKEGWRGRQNLYKLYHILNHFNLFGSGYKYQALNLMESYL